MLNISHLNAERHMFVDTATDIEVRIYHEVVSVQLEVTNFRFKFIFHTIKAVLHDLFLSFPASKDNHRNVLWYQ